MSAEVGVYRWHANRGQLQLVEAQSTYPAGYSGHDKSSAGIGISLDGRFLHATLSGDQRCTVTHDISGSVKVFAD